MKKAGVYTKTGDNGMTSLADRQRVSKADVRIVAIGSVDELNAFIGLFIGVSLWNEFLKREKRFFFDIQKDLSTISAHLGLAGKSIDPERIALIEEKIDEIAAELAPLKNFILPGGNIRAAHLHVLRVICRRAERDVVALASQEEVDDTIFKYLNRLSDFFFVQARLHNRCGKDDLLWGNDDEEAGNA